VPPVAPQQDHTVRVHGHILKDPYFWLRQKDQPEVMKYLKAENKYTDEAMASTQALQDKLYHEMLSRIKETDLSLPVKHDAYYYYTRTQKGCQYEIYCRKLRSLDAEEEVLLDLNALASGKDYFDLGAFEISPNHQYLAYAIDIEGSEIYTLYIKDLHAGSLLSDVIQEVGSDLEWAQDNQTLFYTKLDQAQRPYMAYRHILKTPLNADELIYHEKDEAFVLGLSKSADYKFVFVELSSKTTSEILYLDAHAPKQELTLVAARSDGIEYDLEHHAGEFFILTNENAKNFKLMRAKVDQCARKDWREFIHHRPDVLLEDIDVFKDYLVLYEKKNGLPHIIVMNWMNTDRHEIQFDAPVYTAWPDSNPEYDTDFLRFSYSSMITPRSIYDYYFETKERHLRKQQPVLGGYDPGLYAQERVFATSHDGIRIPLSLVYRKDMRSSCAQPCYLYGYGAYGISMNPEFSTTRLSLLDRGFIFVIAHIRGGEDMGRDWYDQGKLMQKKNSFLDFIACAEYLIEEKFTESKQLMISGGSAGGLLMGAVVNMRPDLFNAVLMHVPFVDMMNTMLDSSLPLTVTEYEEWGDPHEEDAFNYMMSYSPYDNIKAQAYPAMLVTAGLNDPRVQYWEPAKWVAKLRNCKTDNTSLLFKIYMGAGHSGPSGRYDYLKEIAFDYAFLLSTQDKRQRVKDGE